MLSLFSIWRAKSSWETCEIEFSNIVRTPNSPLLSCVFFREVRDFIEVWIVNEHRVTVHRSDLIELLGLTTCVEGGLVQIAKLHGTRAEMRMPCAFRTGQYRKNLWTSKSGTVSKWPSRKQQRWVRHETGEWARWRDVTHVQRTFLAPLSHACVWHARKCANVIVHALCAENVRATSECMYTLRRTHCSRYYTCTKP